MNSTWHIHIEGRVQGVGFRPCVKRVANAMNICGTVSNGSDGVHIFMNETIDRQHEFIGQLKAKLSPAAQIANIHCHPAKPQAFTDFAILPSDDAAAMRLLITPDLALCEACKEDLDDPENRRFGYAFTTCTECGPRFSVMQAVPYDRDTTTMKPFAMCPNCTHEYNSIDNRRYYSQTNSCPECGIQLFWLTNEPDNIDPITHAVKLILDGKTVAVKGIGGFLLLADATNKEAIKTLRKRKNRPNKPFACMVKDVTMAKTYVRLNSIEEDVLTSAEAPIVLTRRKPGLSQLALKQIAPGLRTIGIMLPYAPLLYNIAKQLEVPLVATSANVTGSPIVYKDEDALEHLSGIADAILSNNREIAFPQDDSVVAISPMYQKRVMMRRGRGYAPSLPLAEGALPNKYLALGAEMKSAFAITHKRLTYASPFLGDTSSYEAQQSYNHTLNGLCKLINPKVQNVVVDGHPNYHVSQKGARIANRFDYKLHKVQHHKAHFASILTEHKLWKSSQPVLGIVWDGTGHGEDGQVWGSEFFIYNRGEMTRDYHLSYFPVLSGDRMAKEPAISTYAVMYPEVPGKVWMRRYFSDKEQDMLPQIADVNKQKSCSMGRLFDAVAGLLNIVQTNTFEGEAAMKLQSLAERSLEKLWMPYCLALKKNTLNSNYLLQCIQDDIKDGVDDTDIALRFHQTLVQWIAFVTDMRNIRKVAFSGGVFQNTLLVDLIMSRLGSHHELYFHKIMTPNDENIAIGQIALASRGLTMQKQNKQTKQELCV